MEDPVSLIAIDSESQVAPFEQLRTQLAGLIVNGVLAPGAKLPTVRRLAGDLGLAANTVARSYRELEGDGVIVTQGRRGTFVHSARLHKTPGDVSELASDYAREARRAGLSADEALRLVEQAWRVG